MTRWMWAVCLVFCACKAPVKKTYTVDEVRADVLAEVSPTFGKRQYVITDPAFVDPCIADVVKKGPQALRDVTREAHICIENKSKEPEGLARIEKLIAANYASPPITRDGEVVKIDAGVPPGKLSRDEYQAYYVVLDSPIIDADHRMPTAEVVRLLQLGIAKHPDAKRYELSIVIPWSRENRDWTFAYDRTDDRLHVRNPPPRPGWWQTDPLGGNLANLKAPKLWDALHPQ